MGQFLKSLLIFAASASSLPLFGQVVGNTPPGYTRADFLATNVVRIPVFTDADNRQWLEVRKQSELDSLKACRAFSDFEFADQLEASGITFRHRVVDDAGKTFQAVHYDHGSGLAVADVDGDGLLDLYFVNQRGGNQLWRNLGQGRFEDITQKAGVGLDQRICVTASFADLDNDGKPDLFVTTVRQGNALFHNLGGGRFEEVTAKAGLGYIGHSSGAVFFDFDRDGKLDLFLCNVGVYTIDEKGEGGFYRSIDRAFLGHTIPGRSEASILYRNLGGLQFENVSQKVHLEHSGWSGDATFCDLDRTGFPGLYVVNMSGPDAYYQNAKGQRFQNRTKAVFGRTPWGSMGLKFFDFDQDGDLDLYVTDMHSDMTPGQSKVGSRNVTASFEKQKSEQWCSQEWGAEVFLTDKTNFIFGNAFYRNDGNGSFREVSQSFGVETYWPWGVSVGDLNADGFDDIFVTAGMGYPFRYGINSVLLNDSGRRFYDCEFKLGVEPRPPGKTVITYFVLDCSDKDKDHPLCFERKGELTVKSSTSSRSSAICDLDNDGDLDIVVNNMNDRPQLLISDLAQKRPVHFLKIALQGKSSNADGLGAFVKVRSGPATFTQFHDGKSGYLSQSSMPLYFGLGNHTNIDQIDVLWPSGIKQSITNRISINTLLRITEPAK